MQTFEPAPWRRSFEVVEACRRSRGIEARLVELLGGVPRGRAPGASVLELPARKSTGVGGERAAAGADPPASVDRCAELEEVAA
jgi:hypothetical protein